MHGGKCRRVIAVLTISSLSVVVCSGAPGQIVYAPSSNTAMVSRVPATSAIRAVIDANGGKIPATGAQLWQVLDKLDHFCQLPVAFSAVRLDSGLAHPRVVITPRVDGLGRADVTESNLAGRLFLAANMEREANGDPRVTSVEFISWNTARRQFDFGVIDNMGGSESPHLRIVDGGRCFACHKNRGPTLGARPWSNTTHLPLLRDLVSSRLRVVELLQPGAGGGMRDRIDGMALVSPEAAAVDNAVRLGANLRLHREAFQLMNRSPSGRKIFVALLVAIAAPESPGTGERQMKTVIDSWDGPSYTRFVTDWVALSKTTNSGILADFIPFPIARRSNAWEPQTTKPIPSPPTGGFSSPAGAKAYEARVATIQHDNEVVLRRLATQSELIAKYDTARSEGRHGIPSAAQPSNPRAFLPGPSKASRRLSDMVNANLLAGVIGLTEGDRKFLSRSLARTVERLKKSNVSATRIAQQVFEGPEFAELLAGGPLPDRDEFKDRFAAGLDNLLKTRYQLATGFTVDRKEYASGPRYDPNAVEETEVALVPTTACLRCHDIRSSGKARLFESIPALAFDPFDKPGREAWLRTADKKRKEAVLSRFQKRLFDDNDMPPEDAPEHDRFRVKDAAAFAEVKDFIQAELERIKSR